MKKIRRVDYFELAVFLMDYHSGQFSRGYRLLCKLHIGGNWSSTMCDELRETEMYQYLVATYAGTV